MALPQHSGEKIPANIVPKSTASKDDFEPNSQILNVKLSDPEGFIKYPELQLSRWRDTGDIRGWLDMAPSNGIFDNLFQKVEADKKEIYVPEGIWRLSTPMVLGDRSKYYGPGILKFDNAEWWRRGGSSGSESIPEKYTLFYSYESKEDVVLEYDDISVPFTWVDDRTILATGTSKDTVVRIIVKNGYLRLSSVAENIRSYNIFAGGGGENINPKLTSPLEAPRGYDNTAFGSRSLMDAYSCVNNTAIGSKSLMSNKYGNNNTAVGFLSLYRNFGQGNTAVGSVSGEWLTNGSYNCFFGMASGEKLIDASFNVAIGYQAMYEAKSTKYTVAIGYRANGNTGESSQANSVYIGAFSGDFNIGSNNTMIGYRAGNCFDAANKPGTGTGHNNVGVGFFAMRKNLIGNENVILGSFAATDATTMHGVIAIGFSALSSTKKIGDDTIAIGRKSLENSVGIGNIGLGAQTLQATTQGAGNIAIGSEALGKNLTGSDNTSLGNKAGLYTPLGNEIKFLNNTTTLGSNAKISCSNQVQIGDSDTTTYVYGTVQNRADLRDKADIRNTKIGIDFILGLRAVDGRWDLRDDYIRNQDKIGSDSPKIIQQIPDGSKKRNRYHHWFIAQEVEELCHSLNIDFGGLQHHSVNNGDDIYTLGYDEFIPPIVNAIQSCWKRMDDIEKRLTNIEKQRKNS